MKIAIVGAGLCGLACALECEKLGVYPDIYEKDFSVGWPWFSVNYIPTVIYRNLGNPRDYIKNKYGIEVTPINYCKRLTLKSPNSEVNIQGKLGIFFSRGKAEESAENQLLRKLKRSVIHYNHAADCSELALQYDFVVAATGRDNEARKLNVWEDEGVVHTMAGVASGSFDEESATLYLNTGYAGSGYARLTPFSSTHAIVALNNIGGSKYDMDRLFDRFLELEKLNHLAFSYRFCPPPFTTGRVRKFRIGNILLAGRTAGLTERFIGVGGPEAVISGALAARAIILDQDYDKLVEPLQKHVENISAFRKAFEKLTNEDYDKLLSVIGTPGIKGAVYNTGINFADSLGNILQVFHKQ